MRAALILVPIAWLGSTISGVAGFGGALLLLPALTGVLGPRSALVVLTIAQFFGNLSRAWFGRGELRYGEALRFLAGAIPASILGALAAASLPADRLSRGVGGALIGFAILRRLMPGRLAIGSGRLPVAGAVVGWISGAAGSAGPLGSAVFLSLDLPPAAYVSTEALTALAMHAVKTAVYQRSNFPAPGDWPLGLLLGAVMILGSWTGKKLIGKLDRRAFGLIVDALLVLSGLVLLSK